MVVQACVNTLLEPGLIQAAVALFVAAIAALVIVEARPAADALPPVDPAILGEWSCGDTSIAVAADAIALGGEAARRGRITAEDGRLIIFWEGGDESEWAYAAGGGALILGTDRGPNYTCLAAK